MTDNKSSGSGIHTVLQEIAPYIPQQYHDILKLDAQTTSSHFVALNMVKGYTSQFSPSIREHLQNWRDQCWKLSAQQKPTETSFPRPEMRYSKLPRFGPNGHHDAEIWSAHAGNSLLGWALQINSKPRHIVLFNADTVLSTEILRFGHTSKKDEPYLAGCFGDGMKPEVNRLVTSGVQVTYRTGRSVWRFGFDDSDGMLCKVDTAMGGRETQCTLIELLGIDDSNLRIDPERLIFLLPDNCLGEGIECVLPEYKEAATQGSSSSGSQSNVVLRILFDDRFKRKIFLHGILVQEFSEKFELGIDHIGHVTQEMGLGRDRNQVKESLFFTELMEACTTLQRQQQCNTISLNRLREIVFRGLQGSHCISLSQFSYNEEYVALGEFLYEGMVLEQATETTRPTLYQLMQPSSQAQGVLLPVGTFEKIQEQEAELLRVKFIKISPSSLLSLLRLSPHCPTLESIRNSYFEHFVRLPEFIVDNNDPQYPPHLRADVMIKQWSREEDASLARGLRDMVVSAILSDELPAPSIRFKEFPPGAEPHPITPTKSDVHIYYMVDLLQFSPQKVHQRLSVSDPDFKCDGHKCGCVFESFLDQILIALDMISTDYSRRRLVEKRMRRMMFSKLSNIDTEPFKGQSSPSPSHSPIRSPSNHAPGSPSNHIPSDSPGSSPEPSAGRSPNHSAQSSGAASSSQGYDIPSTHKQQEEGNERYHHTVSQSAAACVQATLTGMDPTSSNHIFAAAEKGRVVLKDCYIPPTEKLNIVKNEQITSALGRYQIPVEVYVQPNIRFEELPHVDNFIRFALLISRIWIVVFDSELLPHRINVFFEKRNVIAFNRNRQLYFNLHYCMLLKNMSLQEHLCYWFVVFCHELAHNQASGHNKEHESHEEELLFMYMPKLVSEMDNMIQSLQHIW